MNIFSLRSVSLPSFAVRFMLAVVCACAAGSLSRSASAASGTWTGGAGNNVWGDNGNWNSATFPGGTGGGTSNTDIATFNANPATRSPPLGAGTLSILGLTFTGTGVGDYTIGTAGGGGAVVTLTSGGTTQLTSTVNNNQVFRSLLVLGGTGTTTYTFRNDSATNKTLTIGNTVRGANSAGTTTMFLDGASTGGILFTSTISNGTGRTLSITKSGSGSATLAAANTYTGSTAVLAGTLFVNGNQSSATGAVTVAAGATLSGTGTIGGSTTISGLHSPGSSPGLQTFASNLAYDTGASVLWQLIASSTASRGTNYDGLNVTGNLAFSGSTSLALSFSGSGSTVSWSDSLWSSNQTWRLYSVSGTTSGFGQLSLLTTNWLDSGSTALLTVHPNASFSVVQTGQNIDIVYQAVPEPAACVLAAVGGSGVVAACLLRRRRRRATTVTS